MSYQIFIKGKEVNLPDSGDFPIQLKRSLIDATQPDKRSADSSYTVKIVNDDRAKLAFGALAMIDRIGTYKQYAAMTESRIYGGGQILLEGLFYLTKVSESELEGYFIASEAPFAQLLNSKTMNQLKLGAIDFDGMGKQFRSANELKEAWDVGQPDSITDSCFFPLAVWGNVFLPNYWGADTNRLLSITQYIQNWGLTLQLAPSRPILEQDQWTVDVGSVGHIDFRSVPPAWFITLLIKQIFADAGYAASGAWFGDETARKTYLIFSGDQVRWNWPFLALGRWSGGLTILRMHQEYQATGGSPSPYEVSDWNFNGQRELTSSYQTTIPQPWGDGITNRTWWVGYSIMAIPNQELDYAFAGRTPGNNNQPFYWTCPADGTYSFDLEFLVQSYQSDYAPADGSRMGAGITYAADGEIPDYVDGNWLSNMQIDNEGWGNVIAITQITGIGIISLSGTKSCIKGDVVFCWIGFTHWTQDESFQTFPPYTPPNPPVQFFPSNSFGVIRALATVSHLFEVQYLSAPENTPEHLIPTAAFQPAQSLPDMSQASFLTAISRMFNLYFEIDEVSKRVTIDSINRIWGANAPRVDLTRMVDKSSVELLPPAVNKTYAFAWASDDADYAGGLVPDQVTDEMLSTQVQVVGDIELSTNPLTLAHCQEYAVIEDSNSDFVDPEWRLIDATVIPHIASQEGYNTQINALDPDGFDFAPKLSCLQDVRAWSVVGPVARVFSFIPPVPDGDFLDNMPWDIRSDSSPIYWPELVRKYYLNWIQALAEGHVMQCDAYIDSNTYSSLTLRATVLVDGVDYSVLEVRGFNPAVSMSKVRLRLSRK